MLGASTREPEGGGVVGMALALLALVALSGCGLQAGIADRSPGRLSAPSPAPPLSGTALEGKSIDLASFRGHPVVIDFWASWCGPCRAEQPELNAAHAKYSRQGVHFIGVDFRDDRASALAFVNEFGVAYPSIFDPDSNLTGPWEVAAPPTTMLVDQAGNIRVRGLGTLTDIIPALDDLLRRPPAAASAGGAPPLHPA